MIYIYTGKRNKRTRNSAEWKDLNKSYKIENPECFPEILIQIRKVVQRSLNLKEEDGPILEDIEQA